MRRLKEATEKNNCVWRLPLKSNDTFNFTSTFRLSIYPSISIIWLFFPFNQCGVTASQKEASLDERCDGCVWMAWHLALPLSPFMSSTWQYKRTFAMSVHPSFSTQHCFCKATWRLSIIDVGTLVRTVIELPISLMRLTCISWIWLQCSSAGEPTQTLQKKKAHEGTERATFSLWHATL